MGLRDFLNLLGGATAIPIAAQQSAIPVIGFINAAPARSYGPQLTAFLKGLDEKGHVDGRTRSNTAGRMATMTVCRRFRPLVRRRVTVIPATTTPAALAAKAATTTIPV